MEPVDTNMTNYNIYNFNLELISFGQVYREDRIKLGFWLASTLSILLAVPLTYGIVWYERSRHYRTLINMLASSFCLYNINFVVLAYLLAVSHLIFGPTGFLHCSLELLLLNVTSMQFLFILNAIVLSKYIFVFHLKNPTAIQEDFFFLFIHRSTILSMCCCWSQ